MHDYKLGINTPIYPSCTFEVDPWKTAEYFAGGVPDDAYLYGRFGHPNYVDLRRRLSLMEGGEDALLFGSGIAATFTLFFAELSLGDHIVVSSRLYGGTRGQIAMLADKLRLKVSVVDILDMNAVRKACRKNTKLMYVESLSNPEVVFADIPKLASICSGDERNILLVVDNTFTPLIVKPLLLGADVVMHSLTKYVSGRSDMMGGALIGKKALMRNIAHPGTGEASLIGGMLHPPVAQEMAERFYQIEGRVREASERARYLAEMLRKHADLTVNYPMSCPMLSARFGSGICFGGVLSVLFPSEAEGVRFVELVCAEKLDDPMLGQHPLVTTMVSLGSAHTYVWCVTEARMQSKVTKWKPLPFNPVPFGSVRIAVGYGGDQSRFLEGFYNVVRKFKSCAPA
jgi:methionine-gamma-lyase